VHRVQPNVVNVLVGHHLEDLDGVRGGEELLPVALDLHVGWELNL